MTQPFDSFTTIFSVLEVSQTSMLVPKARLSEIHKRVFLKITFVNSAQVPWIRFSVALIHVYNYFLNCTCIRLKVAQTISMGILLLGLYC